MENGNGEELVDQSSINQTDWWTPWSREKTHVTREQHLCSAASG